MFVCFLFGGGTFFFAHIWCSLCVLTAAIPESLRNTTCLLSCTVVRVIGFRSGLLLVPFSDRSLAQTCCYISVRPV